MYYDFFGLQQPPYKITPDTGAFYAGAKRGAVLDALVYAVCSGEGITKVVGEVGSGKTMLCRVLESCLPENVEIIYLANPSLSPDNILHAIAFEIGLNVSGDSDRLHVMKALQDYLLAKHSNQRKVVVFVEEAQSMPLETLEEIRLLTNLETKHHKLLQLVLFGQPELDVALAANRVRQLKERITNSIYLTPLDTTEIRDYLMFRLNAAGYRGADVFNRQAIRRIARASKGLMRRINILADKALLAAYTAQSRTVTARHVAAAIHDSEFMSQQRRWRPAWLAIPTMMAVGALGLGALWEQPADAHPPAISTAGSEAAQPVPVTNYTLPHTRQTVNITDEDRLSQRLAATRTWLAASDPRHYTIQISVGSADELIWLERFLSQDDIIEYNDHLYVYQADVGGRQRIGVVYGEFSGYRHASAALAALPDRLKRDGPYVRSIGQVLDDAHRSPAPEFGDPAVAIGNESHG